MQSDMTFSQGGAAIDSNRSSFEPASLLQLNRSIKGIEKATDGPSTATFAIVSDIDGVLTFNNKQVGSTDRVLQQLLSSSSRSKAPLYLASNNGGLLEDEYATKVNNRMN